MGGAASRAQLAWVPGEQCVPEQQCALPLLAAPRALPPVAYLGACPCLLSSLCGATFGHLLCPPAAATLAPPNLRVSGYDRRPKSGEIGRFWPTAVQEVLDTGNPSNSWGTFHATFVQHLANFTRARSNLQDAWKNNFRTTFGHVSCCPVILLGAQWSACGAAWRLPLDLPRIAPARLGFGLASTSSWLERVRPNLRRLASVDVGLASANLGLASATQFVPTERGGARCAMKSSASRLGLSGAPGPTLGAEGCLDSYENCATWGRSVMRCRFRPPAVRKSGRARARQRVARARFDAAQVERLGTRHCSPTSCLLDVHAWRLSVGRPNSGAGGGSSSDVMVAQLGQQHMIHPLPWAEGTRAWRPESEHRHARRLQRPPLLLIPQPSRRRNSLASFRRTVPERTLLKTSVFRNADPLQDFRPRMRRLPPRTRSILSVSG